MNKNIILLGIGAVGAYLLLSRKKANATNVEPIKDSDSTSKEPRSQADCSEGERFSPSESAKEITLTKKDGTTEIVKQEAKPASCIEIRRGRYALPLPEDAPIGASKELLDAMEEVKKLSIGQIMEEYNKYVCRMTAARIKYTPEEAQKIEIRLRALRKEAFDRGIKLDCNINKKVSDRFKFSPVGPGNNIPYGAPPIDNIKRLATGIN